MENLKTKRYAMSLENNIDMNLRFLSDVHDEFREKCKMVAPGKPLPPDVIGVVKRQYREIRDRMTEIRAIQQMLRGKYRRVARRNPVRDKKIDELGFAFKNYYSSFEFNLRALERRRRMLEKEATSPRQLFRIHGNNLKFKEGVKLLGRGKEGYHSLSIIFLKGDKTSIDEISRRGIRLKDGDIFEKYGDDEIRMSITHREESASRRLQAGIARFLEYDWIGSVKGVIYRVEREGDVGGDVEGLCYRALESTGTKEITVVR